MIAYISSTMLSVKGSHRHSCYLGLSAYCSNVTLGLLLINVVYPMSYLEDKGSSVYLTLVSDQNLFLWFYWLLSAGLVWLQTLATCH